MPEPVGQAVLPATGYCWRCLNRRLLAVAATAITPDGDRYCVQELVPCPDCRGPRAGARGGPVTAKGGQHAWRQRERDEQRRAKLAAKQMKRDQRREAQRQDRQRGAAGP